MDPSTTERIASRRQRTVDIHIHAIPPALVALLERGRFGGVDATRDGGVLRFRFPGMAPSPPAPPGLLDFDLLAARARHGLDLQLVGPWTDLLGYTLDRREAAAWATTYNEALAAACDERRGLLPMATIPLAYPDLAVAELSRASALGCRGVMIGTDVPGPGIDSPDLEAVWEAAAGLRMPLLLHPTFISVPEAYRRNGLKNAVARVGEITVAVTRLVYSGALVRHPGLSVIAALGGGAVVPFRSRIERNHDLGWSESREDVGAGLGRLYVDSVVLDPAFLGFLVQQVGADRILLGSDYPFPWEPDPIQPVLGARLAPGDTAQILGGNAERLFGLAEPA